MKLRKFILSTLSAVLGVGIGLVVASPAPSTEIDRAVRAYAAGDYKTAADEWRRLAAAGDRTAQFNIALLFDNPASGLFDSARAAYWYKQAAEFGLAVAQYNLAIAYQIGRGVPKNLSRALFWLLIVSESNDADVASRASSAAEVISLLVDEATRLQIISQAHKWRATPEPSILPSAGKRKGEKPYMTLSQADVRMIQQRLKSIGYNPGPLDGIAGPVTQKAIADYFKDRGGEWHQAPLSHQILNMLR